MKPQDQERIVEALAALDRAATQEHLRADSIGIIERMLGCSRNQAEAILKDLENRKLIDATITPGGQLDARKPMPVARWIWVRPSTRIERTTRRGAVPSGCHLLE